MLGVVILNFNTYLQTIECVESILNTTESRVDILIVDNFSINDSYQILFNMYREIENITVIKTSFNGGYSYGNNIGIKYLEKKGIKYCLVSNNDIIYLDKSIDLMYSFISKNDSAIVGPKIYFPDMKLQHSTMLSKTRFINNFGFTLKGKQLNEEDLIIPTQVYSLSGCSFIINVEKFKDIGYFDENVFLYNEENILFLKLFENNDKVYFIPTAEIIHKHGMSTGKNNFFVIKELLVSTLYYWKRYRNKKFFSLFLLKYVYILKVFIKSLGNKDLRKRQKKLIKYCKIKNIK